MVQPWQSLRHFNLYRLALASAFFAFYHLEIFPFSTPFANQLHFISSIFLYLLFTLCAISSAALRVVSLRTHVWVFTLVDILLLNSIMYYSGGISTGLGLLIIVSMTVATLLLVDWRSFLFPALASLCVLSEAVLQSLSYGYSPDIITQAGLLGLAFFAATLLAYGLSSQLQLTQALAHQRSADLKTLEALNEHIVQEMKTGVIVTDQHAQVRLVNQAAWTLLGQSPRSAAVTLESIAPDIAAHLQKRANQDRQDDQTPQVVHGAASHAQWLVDVKHLGTEQAIDLIFFHDASKLKAQAQAMKLASLGRFTASIAHEIRNPLAALSHAAQLLQENTHLPAQDQRLVQIIRHHCQRLNTVVDNILQLSRDGPRQAMMIMIGSWLETFLDQFHVNDLDKPDIACITPQCPLWIRVDPSQLEQILTNLLTNGLRHTTVHPGRAALKIIVHSDDQQHLHIDIVDFGPGIQNVNINHLFEPFFTTQAKGTGLGLYIAKALCEANQAQLHYIGRAHDGHCFRISFAAQPKES